MSSATLQAILDNPRYHDYLAILKGARNGFVYGAKVRFPHALIMAILFGRGEYVSKGGSYNPIRPFSIFSLPKQKLIIFFFISFSHSLILTRLQLTPPFFFRFLHPQLNL